MRYPPTHDSRKAILSRLRSPGYGWCGRCGMPWSKVKGHDTSYGRYCRDKESQGKGCFPLCEGCWQELGSPEARIEYYKRLVDRWIEDGCKVTEDEMQAIKRAVANGG